MISNKELPLRGHGFSSECRALFLSSLVLTLLAIVGCSSRRTAKHGSELSQLLEEAGVQDIVVPGRQTDRVLCRIRDLQVWLRERVRGSDDGVWIKEGQSLCAIYAFAHGRHIATIPTIASQVSVVPKRVDEAFVVSYGGGRLDPEADTGIPEYMVQVHRITPQEGRLVLESKIPLLSYSEGGSLATDKLIPILDISGQLVLLEIMFSLHANERDEAAGSARVRRAYLWSEDQATFIPASLEYKKDPPTAK